MTEAKAELNAGLIIVTGHAPTHTGDVDMDQGTPDASMPPAEAAGSDASDARASKQDALSIQPIINLRMNGLLRFVTAEPISWPPQRYQKTLRKRSEVDWFLPPYLDVRPRPH